MLAAQRKPLIYARSVSKHDVWVLLPFLVQLMILTRRYLITGNHIGKFATLAIELRKEAHKKEKTSFECWPTNLKGWGDETDTAQSGLPSALTSLQIAPNIGREVSKEKNLILNPNFEDGWTLSWKAFSGRSMLKSLKRQASAYSAGITYVVSTTDSKDWHGITQKIGPRLTEGVRHHVSAVVQVDTAGQDVLIGFSEGDHDEDQTVVSPRQQNGSVVSEMITRLTDKKPWLKSRHTIDVENEWVQLQRTFTASSDKDTMMYIKTLKGIKLLVDYVEVAEANCDFNKFVHDFNPDKLEINCSNWDQLKMGKVLGHGQSGQVVEATWRGNKVAVRQPLNAGWERSHPKEVLRVAALNYQFAHSENIMKIIGMCHSSLVFEYAPTTLKSVVFGEEKLSVKKSLSLGLDIVKGLAQLHAIGPVVHGDLRISQYLVNLEGKVLLGDLESSRYVGLDKNGNKCTFWKKAGGVGTFNSPERMAGSTELDEKTDIYCNALTLWTVFMREFPYKDEKNVTSLVLSGERPSLDGLEGYPQEVKDMLEEAWDTNPMKRPSAEDMVKTMTAVVKNYMP